MRRAGDILRVFLDRHTTEQAERYHTFFSAWQQVVGERIAAHSEVKDIENGIVLVEVDHPGWIQMIQLKQTQFVQTLRKRYPDLNVRGLRLQLPWGVSSRRPVGAERGREQAAGEHSVRRDPADAGEEPHSRQGEEAADTPADPLIRGALDRLGRAIERRAEDR